MLNDDPQNSPSKVTKPVHQQKEEKGKYMRASPQSHTQKRNLILVKEQIAGPCTIYFKWVLCLPGPVARDGKRIYLAMKIY